MIPNEWFRYPGSSWSQFQPVATDTAIENPEFGFSQHQVPNLIRCTLELQTLASRTTNRGPLPGAPQHSTTPNCCSGRRPTCPGLVASPAGWSKKPPAPKSLPHHINLLTFDSQLITENYYFIGNPAPI